jgi:hypothetical protein
MPEDMAYHTISKSTKPQTFYSSEVSKGTFRDFSDAVNRPAYDSYTGSSLPSAFNKLCVYSLSCTWENGKTLA